jgi:hypothetical protein
MTSLMVPIGSQSWNGSAVNDQFGFSVSLSAADGNAFVVGAPLHDSLSRNNTTTFYNAGQVNVCKYNTTLRDYQKFGPSIEGTSASDQLGFAVSLSADGSSFVVGVPHGGPIDAGPVQIYQYNATIQAYRQVGSNFGW